MAWTDQCMASRGRVHGADRQSRSRVLSALSSKQRHERSPSSASSGDATADASRACSEPWPCYGRAASTTFKRPAGRGVHLRAAAALLLVAAIAAGCKALVAEAAYQPTPLPADVTELYRVFGDAGADTVWIYEQGGPVHILEDNPLRQFRHYPGRDAVLFAQVHQTLTIDDDLVSRHRELSFEELQAEVDVSIEILHRVIEHFKAEGKQVVVVGHSYGRVPHPPATCGARGPAPPTVI